MALFMKEAKLFDPFHIGLFGEVGIVFEANGIADRLEGFPALWRLGGEL
jgi:hypothetical protein